MAIKENRIMDLEFYAGVVHTTFATLYHTYQKGRPKRFEQDLGQVYSTTAFPKAERFPLLQLIYECNPSTHLKKMEVLIRIEHHPFIQLKDIDKLIEAVQNRKDTLFIVITRGFASFEAIQKLNEAYNRYSVPIILLDDTSMIKITTWLKEGKINACIVYLYMRLHKTIFFDLLPKYTIDQQPWLVSEESFENIYNFARNQNRTIVKKLQYLILNKQYMYNISDVCTAVKITRMTLYNWMKTDLIFAKLYTLAIKHKKLT